MFPALCVIVALKLKQQIAHFFAENRQKLLNSLFKTDVSLKNLNDEMLLDNLLFDPNKCKNAENKEMLAHTINFIYDYQTL